MLWNPDVFKRWHMTWAGPRVMTPELLVEAADSSLHTEIYVELPQMMLDIDESHRWYALQADLKEYIQKNYPMDEQSRFYTMGLAARDRLHQGDVQKASQIATEYLAMADKYAGGWNYGNALHDGNEILGLVALKSNGPAAIEQAKTCLAAAAKTPGSRELSTVGPDLELADQLLQLNQRQAVLDYLKECDFFWDAGRNRIADLITDINAGLTPRLVNVAPTTDQSAAALIGRWEGEDVGHNQTPTRAMNLMMQFDADGFVTASVGMSSRGTYTAENGMLSLAPIAGGKSQATTGPSTSYKLSGDELVLHDANAVFVSELVDTTDMTFRRVSPPRPGAPQIVGQWLATTHSKDMGDVKFEAEFKDDQTCRTTFSFWPVRFNYRVISYNALIFGPQSAEHHATFSVNGDQMTIVGFQYGEAETNAPISMHRVTAWPPALPSPPTSAATTIPAANGN
jgi:hypothetical protein